MNIMQVSRLFSVAPNGPVSAASGELVHLRQGDLDGACGPYCLFSALITLGLLQRDDLLENMSFWKGSSREGRLRDALKKFGVLSSDGTFGWDLVELTSYYKRMGLIAQHDESSKKQVMQSVCEAIDVGRLPIVGVDWIGGGGHWLLVVGYQGVKEGDHIQRTHLLCLDPWQESPKASLWNAVIEVYDAEGGAVNKGRLSSNHWNMRGEVTKCQVKDTVILSIKL
ncbi:hypothetical protein [Aquipseudomonas alcaligenes]|uniref:Uncharacterized protein n=1 Tax=Aquipseudomonas alcaligenes TaxID=43263 RepID=A0AA42MXJ0_AQUAC|nr:hypothetical protein [Pseudomonas alcaligenes]MDH1053613.1 hypothetical protein [Pseudomonas alcaligenes]